MDEMVSSFMCRACEAQSNLIDISTPDNHNYLVQFLACANVTFEPNDGLPPYLCRPCTNSLATAYQFRQKCEHTQKKLQDLLVTTPVKMEFVTVKAEPIVENDLNARKTRSNARKPFISTNKATKELRAQDDETGKFKRKFICDICKKRCMAKFTIELHMKSKHNMATNLRQCPHCEKYFTSRKYPRHMDKHDKPYECGQCSKRFSSDTNLRRHISDIHQQLKQFLCSTCGKSFAQKSDLRIHISRMHLNDYYSCSTCGKSYKSKYIVQQHEMTHLPEEEQEKLIACGKYKRPKQNRLTTNELTMQYYSKLINTDQVFADGDDKPIDPERPFRCNWCGKYFKSKAVRYLHMRIHMGDKRYKCDVCDRKFTQNNQLQTHKRTHTGEKPFKCDYCERTFACKKSCVAHMRLHTGEKPYRCEVCGECFIDLNGLKRHRKKVHPN